ncbi:hypothetical protein CL617_00605 [archaeon]|nr:hypothetical protein [archaeon]
MKKQIKILLISLFSFSLFLFLIYYPILKPSKYSVVAVCVEDSERLLEEQGLFIAGSTYVNFTEDGEIENIRVSLLSDDKIVYKHELIHVKQAMQKRIFSCHNTVLMFTNELEAYTMQFLPNRIFEKIYL